MKKFFFGITVLLLLSAPFAGAHEGEVHLEYNVIRANDGTVTWYDSNFNPINYTFEGVNEIVVDVSETGSPLNITIGEFVRTNITINEASSALILGYWEFNVTMGFVGFNQSKELENEVSSTTYLDSLNVEESTQTIGGKDISVTSIEIKAGGQHTVHYYSETGVLTYLNTSFGNYHLEMELSDIEGEAITSGNPLPSPFMMMLGSMALLVMKAKISYFSLEMRS